RSTAICIALVLFVFFKQKTAYEMDALLVLEDGYSERGVAFGFPGEFFGEIVFNTCITGYQEILTDPSYQDQVIVFTYPQIGNYGVNVEDVESSRIFPSAIVVR